MPSSIYAAWSVVAGEQPTTAKWNILGSNDSSFNTGVGFNDSVILSRHLALSKTTDANGWTVYDFGAWKEYARAVSVSAAVTNGQRTLMSSIQVPVGRTAANIFIAMSWHGNFAGHATPGIDVPGGTQLDLYLGNEYSGGALTFSGNFKLIAKDM